MDRFSSASSGFPDSLYWNSPSSSSSPTCGVCGSPSTPNGFPLPKPRTATGRLVPRDCAMPGGGAPFVYWVDLDTGLSYWQRPPAVAVRGTMSPKGGGSALYSPRNVAGTAAGGDVSPLTPQSAEEEDRMAAFSKTGGAAGRA